MKILVFAPHAQIWKHAFPEALVAESLLQKGHEIIYVKCNGIFNSHCIPMISNHISYNASSEIKQKICTECIKNASLLEMEFKFPTINLEDYLNVENKIEINEILKITNKSNFRNLIIDGIKVGEIAAYQVLLRYKQSKNNDFDEVIWGEYLKQLDVTLRALFSLKKIIKNVNPDRIMQYSGVYSVYTVCRELANSNDIPTYFYHAGLNQRDRLKSLIIGKEHPMVYIKSLFVSWDKFYKHIPCSFEDMKLVTNNFIDLLNGNSFLKYSKSKSVNNFDIRKCFNISKDQKIVLGILSSYDEHLAAESIGAYKNNFKPLFETQIEWVKELIQYFTIRKDLFLIIRVHPREFPTMREKKNGIVSQHAKDLQKVLLNLPDNICVNWPNENISFYDLIEETNLFLNAFSSAAREITMLGLPVLTYNNEDVLEQVSFNYNGVSLNEYFNLIDELLKTRFDPERIRIAYRWRALEQIYGHINISESYNDKDDLFNFREKILKLFQKIIDKVFPILRKKYVIKIRSKKLKSSEIIEKLFLTNESNLANLNGILDNHKIDDIEELRLLRLEIKRLLPYLYSNKDYIKPGSLQSYLSNFVSQ